MRAEQTGKTSRELAAELAAIGRSQAMIEFSTDGRIITANANYLATMGYALHEIVGLHHALFMPPGEETHPDYATFWDELGAGEYKSGVFKRVGKGNREVWLQASYNPVFDAKGRPFKVIKIAVDVTQASLQTADHLGQLRAIWRTQAVIEFALDGTILNANETFLRALGYRLPDLVGRHHGIFLTPEDRVSAAYRAFWADLRRGMPRSGEFRRVTKGGARIWLHANYTPILDLDGQPYKIVKFAKELTGQSRRLAEARDAAERANTAKTRFLAGMSHELRTPLNGILGNARLLRLEGGLNPAQEARVKTMVEAGTHLLELIHCVLDLSEIETERVAMQKEQVEPRRVGTACLDVVRPIAAEKHLALGLVVQENVPARFMTDPVRLRQILLNLLGNAIKFTRRGRVELRLHVGPEAAMLRFEVADTGPGIPADQRARLFQEFSRLQTEETRAGEGAGLGLALSARLAMLLGGRIGHVDNPAGGSIFWLELPLAKHPAPAMQAKPANSHPASAVRHSAKGRTLRLLVVDDSEMNLDIAASFLRLLGHHVTCAGSGAEAIRSVATGCFDAVFMDVQMPEMDGLQATRHIRDLPGAAGKLPVVALTAQVFTEQLEACRQAGMTSHLAKPFTEAALDAVLAEIAAVAGHDPGHDEDAETEPAEPVPVFDLTTFNASTRLLKPDSVVNYLKKIAADAASVAASLRSWGGQGDLHLDIPRAAHKLAGNAGLLGFGRAANAARDFEHATQHAATNVPALAEKLATELELACAEADRIMRKTVLF